MLTTTHHRSPRGLTLDYLPCIQFTLIFCFQSPPRPYLANFFRSSPNPWLINPLNQTLLVSQLWAPHHVYYIFNVVQYSQYILSLIYGMLQIYDISPNIIILHKSRIFPHQNYMCPLRPLSEAFQIHY